MKRAGVDRFAHVESVEAAFQFCGGFTGEGECQHVACVGSVSGNSVSDSTGEHGGLARPCSGHDGERRVRAGDGIYLLRVEPEEEVFTSHRRDATVPPMPYPQKKLNPDETVALDSHPHWWFLVEPLASLVGAVLLGLIVLTQTDSGSNLRKLLQWVDIALLVGTAAWLLGRYLRWSTIHFVITSQRLIYREGLLARSGIEIPLERVNNVNFTQGFLERILGAGNLLIESGGEDGQQRFTDIRHPEDVQNLIHTQMEKVAQRRGGYSQAQSAGSVDVADQLERLEGLLERGSITEEEFEQQKRRLLD